MSDINIKVNIVSNAAKSSIRALESETKRAEKGFQGLNLSIKNSTGALAVFAGNIATRAFSSLIGGLAELGAGFIESASSVEQLNTKLEVLTGSSATAGALLKELTEFAAGTPFQLEGISQAASQLLAFGFNAGEVKDRLREIGDVAAASGQPLTEIATIYGQVAAAGRLTGERLVQLRERAVPIGEALAKTMGETEAAVSSLVSQGKVDFATFQKAFASLSDEGGKAFGGMAKLSQTLKGRVSTLKDNFFLLQNDVGQKLTPALKAATTTLTNFIATFRVSPQFNEFLVAMGEGIPKAISFTGSAIDAANFILNKYRQEFEALSLVATLAMAGLAQSALAVLEPLSTLQAALGLDTSSLDSAIGELETFRDVSTRAAVDSANAIEEIQVQQESFSQTLKTTTDEAIRIYNSEIQAITAKAEAAKESDAAIVASAEEKNALLEEIRVAQKALDDETKLTEADIAAVEQEAKLQLIAENIGREEAIKTAARQRELKASGKDKLAELELEKKLTQAKNKELILREQRAQQAEQTRQQNFKSSLGVISTLQGSSNKTLFAIGKAAAISTATIDGIAAVQKALASAPPPFNFAIAALVGTATALNVAKIASARPPAYQSGGIVPGNSFTGDRVNARLNSGELILNRAQQDRIAGQLGGSGDSTNIDKLITAINNQPIIVEVDSVAIARANRKGLEAGA